eukprot:Sspe_Gene.72835::Locus_43641_Transcript_1_1_Confidence_1.000_Length_3303::g.72835::m.72835
MPKGPAPRKKEKVEEEFDSGPPPGWEEATSYPYREFEGFDKNIDKMTKGCKVLRCREGKRPTPYWLKLDETWSKVTFVKEKVKESQNPLLRHTLWLVDIKSIQKGQQTPGFRSTQETTFITFPWEERVEFDLESSQRSMTVHYDIPRKSEDGLLEVVFNEDSDRPGKSSDFCCWFWTLQYLKLTARMRCERNPFPVTLDKMWVLGDTSGDGLLSEDEVFELLKRVMNIDMKKKKKEELFKRVDRRGEGKLNRSDFERLVWYIKQHPVCDKLWNKYAAGSTRMKDKQLSLFHTAEQEVPKSKVTIEGMQEITTFLTGSVGGMDQRMWNIFLTQSALNDALSDETEMVYQPMDRFWADYHVKFATHVPRNPMSPSEGNPESLVAELLGLNVKAFHCQLFPAAKGRKDDGPWVGDPKGRKQDCCLLRDLLTAFRDNAFRPDQSSYPIILIFEVICKEKDQLKAVEMIQELLGFRLKEATQAQVMKCPDQAHNSFLLASYPTTSSTHEAPELVDEWNAISFFGCLPYTASPSTTEKSMRRSNPYIVIMNWDQVDGQCESEGKWSSFRASTYKWLAAYVPNFDGHEVVKLKELATVDGKKVEVECEWDDGVRVATAFAAGVNLVGMNYHLADKNDHKSQIAVGSGRFVQNGNCGWVLKPRTLRHVPLLNPRSESQISQDTKKKKKRKNTQNDKADSAGEVLRQGAWRIVLNVISAHQLPSAGDFDSTQLFLDYNMTDPFVEVRCDGLRSTSKYRTRTVQDNGFNPMWEEEITFEIEDAEEAILTFSVMESDLISTETLAQRSVPVCCLQSGYRCLFLRDHNGGLFSEFPSIFFCIRFQRRGDIVHLLDTEDTIRKQIQEKLHEVEETNRMIKEEQDKIRRIQKAYQAEQADKKEIDTDVKRFMDMKFSFGIFSFFFNRERLVSYFTGGEEEEEEEAVVKREEIPYNTAAPPTKEERLRRSQMRMERAGGSQVGTAVDGSVANRQAAQTSVRRFSHVSNYTEGRTSQASQRLTAVHLQEHDKRSRTSQASQMSLGRLSRTSHMKM